MNKPYLKKSVGAHVQLRPVPRTRQGEALDQDWIVRSVDDEFIRLDEPALGYTKKLGLDHVHSFMSNPDRDRPPLRYGFLRLHVQLIIDGITIHTEPLSPYRNPESDSQVTAPSLSFSPLIVADRGRNRYFSWRGRDPLHQITIEEPPRQLFQFFVPLCGALRGASGMEPQFDIPGRNRGELVYELSPDFRAKWRLLGGMGGAAGDQELILVPIRR
jgi:hypothetical protein